MAYFCTRCQKQGNLYGKNDDVAHSFLAVIVQKVLYSQVSAASSSKKKFHKENSLSPERKFLRTLAAKG